jgi:energy-coupling factor transporter ATP-binding protein EcfA2
MLKRLFIKNFTVFAEADFEFGPGLNVVVGTNGTGKSHVLKLGYVIGKTRASRSDAEPGWAPIVEQWQTHLLQNLRGVFRVENYKDFIRKQDINSPAVIEAQYFDGTELKFEVKSETRSNLDLPVMIIKMGATSLQPAPVFLPPKEVLSMFPGLQSFYNRYELALEQTYPDLCAALELPVRRAPDAYVLPVIQALEEAIGGRVKLENGRFYFTIEGKTFVIDMAAEGIRKLATLAQLLVNDSLTPKNTLFWDEPEANLNPALLQKLAAVLAELAQQGFQIILATHSLFLLKELHILSRRQNAKPMPIRYFGLNSGEDGATTVTTVDDFEELPDIVALDVQLEQNGLFLDVLNGTE